MDLVKAGTRVLLSDGDYDIILKLTQDVEDWGGEWVGVDEDDGRVTGINGHMCSDIIVGDEAIADFYA